VILEQLANFLRSKGTFTQYFIDQCLETCVVLPPSIHSAQPIVVTTEYLVCALYKHNSVVPVQHVDTLWRVALFPSQYRIAWLLLRPVWQSAMQHKLPFMGFSIQGSSGMGKTSFLQLLQDNITAFFPDKQILYLNQTGWVNTIMNGYQNKTLNHLQSQLSKYDVCLLDDIDQLGSKKASQNHLAKFLQHLLQQKKCVIVTYQNSLESLAEKLQPNLYNKILQLTPLRLPEPSSQDIAVFLNYLYAKEFHKNIKQEYQSYLEHTVYNSLINYSEVFLFYSFFILRYPQESVEGIAQDWQSIRFGNKPVPNTANSNGFNHPALSTSVVHNPPPIQSALISIQSLDTLLSVLETQYIDIRVAIGISKFKQHIYMRNALYLFLYLCGLDFTGIAVLLAKNKYNIKQAIQKYLPELIQIGVYSNHVVDWRAKPTVSHMAHISGLSATSLISNSSTTKQTGDILLLWDYIVTYYNILHKTNNPS
jgi:Bacterial dnaA  protein